MFDEFSFGGTPEYIKAPSLATVGEGVDHANSFIFRMLQNEKIDGLKWQFGPGLIQELHRRILFYYPKWAGQFRLDDDTRVGDIVPVKAILLPDKVYLFETWLADEINKLKQDREDLVGALRVASAAHFGIVGELHPFDDGNGRTARVLVNSILMLNTHEALSYGQYILPAPQLRDRVDEEKIKKVLETGKEPKLMPYLKAIVDVSDTWTLTPFEIFLASRWIETLENFLSALAVNYQPKTRGSRKSWKSFLNGEERILVEKMEQRKQRLQLFINENLSGARIADKVPDYFAPRHIRV